MEQNASVTSLVIVVLVAFFTPIVRERLKLTVVPVVVTEIIAGLIIGKSGFDLIGNDPWLEILSTFGLIFLMFLSGVEIDFSIFSKKSQSASTKNGKKEPNSFLISSIIFLFILILSYLLSLGLAWLHLIENTFFMTLIIATISLGVVLPTLKEENLTKTVIGQTILIIAVLADLVTMVLLAVFVTFSSKEGGNTWLLLLLFAAGVLLYFLARWFKKVSFFQSMLRGSIQIDTRAIFALLIVLVGLSESLGAENILGAFLAGVLISLLSPNPDTTQKLDSFGYGFLIPIFFVMVGVELDIWTLLSDPNTLLLIPLLFLALVISKLLPILLLKRWYDWRTVLGAGFLLTSTLSLVIAAAEIGKRVGVIGEQKANTLVLLAVVTSIITPMLFKKIFPQEKMQSEVKNVAFIGANQLTLPLSIELDPNKFKTFLYHTKQEKVEENKRDSSFSIRELPTYHVLELKEANVFESDIVVISTGDEESNAEIARYAKEFGVDRVIARIESQELGDELREEDIEVFSTMFSSKVLLRELIESPSVAQMFTKQENGLFQINMSNTQYDGIPLRQFPYLGDAIIVRVFRGKDSIVPHGDTELKLGDRIVVTGSTESVNELRNLLSY
ncbi:sodium:proton antiporter [Pueribacillus theae]|uniref:Sodium:proton antiporter n=1 Tax=Pueribacillus theae TaxID=2171751 RepID=A0A2U1K723_9BACI|nr:monovalent cation:proton antiporter family protein [Pueribacillus theae]PWA12688.1 sodium:proton antiporter [Pueribacillus theae]